MFRSFIEQFDIMIIRQKVYFGRWFTLDLYIFHVILILFLIFIILLYLHYYFYYYRRRSRLVPRGWQYVIEIIYNVVYTIVKQQTGQRGYIYLPLIFTLFLIIVISNLFSLMPYSFALTSQIINIFFLSFTLILGLFVIGLSRFGLAFLKLFVPESPLLLMLILVIYFRSSIANILVNLFDFVIFSLFRIYYKRTRSWYKWYSKVIS